MITKTVRTAVDDRLYEQIRKIVEDSGPDGLPVSELIRNVVTESRRQPAEVKRALLSQLDGETLTLNLDRRVVAGERTLADAS